MELTLTWAAVILMVVTSAGLLFVRDWRWSMILLALQYLGMFILIFQHWPIGMASVKLVAGWMSAAILGMTRSGLPDEVELEDEGRSYGRLFHLFAAGIVVLIAAVVTPAVDTLMADAGFPVTNGGLLLIGMGLFHLGITVRILRVVIGLMTVMAGFEIIYSAVEGSVLVAGLLAVITLGLALVGSYLLVASSSRETEPP